MSRPSQIFQKVHLHPKQLRTVADRRMDDATALRDTRRNARANGAMYLGGFVVECRLKARLLEKHPWLQSSPPRKPSAEQQLLRRLLYSHELDAILARLPEIPERMARLGAPHLRGTLLSICAEWSIYARYSPQSTTIEAASQFLNQIKELRPWLD